MQKVRVDRRDVTIPSKKHHEGCPLHQVTVTLKWECPQCGGPRGDVEKRKSYDGSRPMIVDGWSNPCGHVDRYSDVRTEALRNGLNSDLK